MTAAERREQRLRAHARAVGLILCGVAELAAHEGQEGEAEAEAEGPVSSSK